MQNTTGAPHLTVPPPFTLWEVFFPNLYSSYYSVGLFPFKLSWAKTGGRVEVYFSRPQTLLFAHLRQRG